MERFVKSGKELFKLSEIAFHWYALLLFVSTGVTMGLEFFSDTPLWLSITSGFIGGTSIFLALVVYFFIVKPFIENNAKDEKENQSAWDMSLRECINHIALNSEFALTADGNKLIPSLLIEFCRPLADSEHPLKARGVLGERHGNEWENAPTTIPDKFWLTANLPIAEILRDGVPGAPHNGCFYKKVQFNRAMVEKEWPSRSAQEISEKPGVFASWIDLARADRDRAVALVADQLEWAADNSQDDDPTTDYYLENPDAPDQS